MKSNLLTILVVMIFLPLISLLVLDCSSRSNPTGPDDSGWPTPRANKEAEEAALWLSDSLIAPEWLYQDILIHLAVIRTLYGDSIQKVREIEFVPPWSSNSISLKVTEQAREQIRAGEYHDLDLLNFAFHHVSTDTILLGWLGYIYLSFEGRLNPERLAELYSEVPSVLYASQASHRIGDYPNIYPWFSDNGVTYLLRDAWGDCPSGCIYSIYWYFKAADSGIEYIGFWDPQTQPEPDWWEQGKAGMWHYMRFDELLP